MQRIRLSQNVALEITDEVISRDMNAAPFIHLYEWGANYGNNKTIVLEDGQTEERANSYWRDEDNVILGSTPEFYPDDKIAANFHADHRIDNLLTNTIVSSMQYRKLRMLFASGFAYDTDDVQAALTTLNIYAKLPSNNARIDLLSFYDPYDDSKILATDQVLFSNQLYTAAIDLYIVDVAFLYNSTAVDVVEFRERLFGTDEIETLFVEHAGVIFSDITTFSEFGNTYSNFAAVNATRQSFAPRYNETEIICFAEILEDCTISMQMQHERFNLEGYLETQYTISDVSYTIKFDHYDISNTLLGSDIVKVSSPLDLFEAVRYKPRALDNATYINVDIQGLILTSDNARIEKSAQLVITTPEKLRTQTVNVTLEQEKLVRTTTKEIKTAVFKPDTPNIIRIEKPVYVSTVAEGSELELVPYKHAKIFETSIDLTKTTRLRLQIGTVSITNDINNKTTFQIPEKAYFQEAETYFMFDTNDQVIWHGAISRVRQ